MLSSNLILTTVLTFMCTAPSLLEPINVSMKKGIRDLQHNNLPNTICTILNRNNNAACRTKLQYYKPYIPLYQSKYKKNIL